jgi:hypothetical protein
MGGLKLTGLMAYGPEYQVNPDGPQLDESFSRT